MLGYVITNNNTGHDKGFFSPFPGLVVKIHDHFRGIRSPHWDYWSLKSELNFRKYGN